jgi:hypothetical protein
MQPDQNARYAFCCPVTAALTAAMGTPETLGREIWGSALAKLLLMDAAKSEFLDFLPK